LPRASHADLQQFERIKRRLITALVALVAVTMVGVAGFSVIGGAQHGFIDALYMTVITLTTVGYGEVIDLSHHPGGRLFTIALLMLGMGIVAYSVPMVTAFIVEGQFFRVFDRRRMQKMLAELKDHYIVCGDTVTAAHVAKELDRSGRQLALVGPTDDALALLQEAAEGAPGTVGDPTDEESLLAVGIERAAGLVACTRSDKDNLLVVLTARRLAPQARIIAAAERQETGAKMRAVGADGVVSPSRIGGLRMASELVRPRVVTFLDRMLRDERASLRVEEIAVPASSHLVGRKLEQLYTAELRDVLLLAIADENGATFEFKPSVERSLRAGERLVVMADANARARIEKSFKG
jgi:voltage-gated potassium channel